ncbi:MAG: c-type cytochrome, partial [Planctomycetota bacterium]
LAPFDQTRVALTECLASSQPAEVQKAALGTLDRYPPAADSPIPGIVLDAWGSMPPAARPDALAFLLAHPTRAHALLDRIEAKAFPTSDLQAHHIDRLIRSGSTRDRARQLVLVDTATPRLEVVERFTKAIDKLDGDTARGKALFAASCAACHELEGVGVGLAPNLAAFAARGRDAILTNLFDPNREVDPAFTTYLLETNDGRTLAGMISAETPSSIVLTRADGHTDTLPRDTIRSLQSTGRSLMPEGLEATLDEQATADLVAYLMSFLSGR